MEMETETVMEMATGMATEMAMATATGMGTAIRCAAMETSTRANSATTPTTFRLMAASIA